MKKINRFAALLAVPLLAVSLGACASKSEPVDTPGSGEVVTEVEDEDAAIEWVGEFIVSEEIKGYDHIDGEEVGILTDGTYPVISVSEDGNWVEIEIAGDEAVWAHTLDGELEIFEADEVVEEDE